MVDLDRDSHSDVVCVYVCVFVCGNNDLIISVPSLLHLVSGKEDTVCYTAVSGFIFLRFFAPAILNPKLFHLRPEFPVSENAVSAAGPGTGLALHRECCRA